MIDAVSFKTRARTIDHLGREQIADCPTAISELWKNAYDAYAREVALHIYHGAPPIAALVDDGHGMNLAEFLDKWLVVGTESKTGKGESDERDRKGLRPRPRQGQKGIGRLSAAALGPLLLFVSKRADSNFVVALIDWRLFENPFLLLDDVEIPVIEAMDRQDVLAALPEMFNRLMGNVWGNGLDPDRDSRIVKAWGRFDEMEKVLGNVTTKSQIESVLIDTTFEERHFTQWTPWNDPTASGTALLVSDVSFDLQAQLNVTSLSSQEQPEHQARSKLFQTLSNFTDPFVSAEDYAHGAAITDFEYSVIAWHGDLKTSVISKDKSFGYENLENLEHVIEGDFDELGVFRGRVKVFGKWIDETVVVTPKSPGGSRVDTRVGPFRLRIGTFEQTLENSSHPEEIWAKLVEQANLYAGFMVYRDGLRVMPYGREDNDFFEIEKRRTSHAGREFWSYRRIFGRVAIARDDNPNLKDKAGREGIIDNKAAKIFRDLVENLLMTSARRYFGTDSKIRKDALPEIRENREQEKAEQAQKSVRARQRREFRQNLAAFLPVVEYICDELEQMAESARQGNLPADETSLIKMRSQVAELQGRRSELTFGAVPTTLGSLAPEYRQFRKSFNRSSELIAKLNDSILAELERIRPKSARDIAYAELSRNANFLHTRLRKWNVEARQLLSGEMERLASILEERNKKYHAACLPLLDGMQEGDSSLPRVLATLADERERIDVENSEIFLAYISTLRSLRESVDIDALVSFSMARYEEASKEIARLNSLAQLGVTVEIIGHEMDGLELTISEALRESPQDFKETRQFKSIRRAHEELSHRLRFLSPLKLSGERSRDWISGQDIFDYSSDFLHRSLESSRVILSATSEFRRFSVFEQRERIFPVFINLINNSIYWAGNRDGQRGEILLDVVSGQIVVSDNGPGVDPEDVDRLFTLFFTTKVRGGRGVGLYLCRANLAIGGHTIAYATAPEQRLLPGANFIINFKGAKYE
ncbi:ATP-binding protein [Burkholderia cepacia]|uniref:ATP-binding protein n=1 Tax=Burkholderia cepacia TaxID=292 RepID=UPI001CF24AF2|nr:ATP-binding protein [Burkholderia cepacia]MCA7905230.1 ATP-binding protein [Burkholderia cepacia]